MKKGYRKITFSTLQELVANIDYVFDDSFPDGLPGTIKDIINAK